MKNWIPRVSILFLMFALLSSPALSALKHEQWAQDVSYLAEQLPLKHPNPFKKQSQDVFERAVADLQQRIPNLGDPDMAVEIARIVALVHDGHSFVDGFFPMLEFKQDTYPIRLYDYSDGIHIQTAQNEYARYVGAKVLSINGQPIASVFDQVKTVFPTENEMGERAWAMYGLISPQILHAFHVVADDGKVVFQLEKDDKKLDLDLTSKAIHSPQESFGVVVDPAWLPIPGSRTDKAALRWRHLDKMYWYDYDSASRVFYVQFNQVRDWGEQGVLDFFNEVVAEVEGRDVDRFVLDLRLNPGGETYLNNPIVKTLLSSGKINRSGHFFVLIGRRTFSSAQLICTALEQYSQAVFIGEPSGINTHFLASSRKSIVLPNSGMAISLSTNWWQTTNSKEMQKWQRPDIAIDESADDWFESRDPALDAAIAYQKPVDVRALFDAALASNLEGLESTTRQFRDYKRDTRYRYVDTESNVNDFGYALLERGDIPAAIRYFEFNTIDYPASVNAFDSLGEAFVAGGKTVEAIAAYKKVLSFDPGNGIAAKAIRRLEASQGR